MIRRVVNEIRRQYLGAIALFLVVAGGTSYAAVHLSAGSVGTRQLRNHAVTNRKLARGAVGARDLDHKTIVGYLRAYARVDGSGKLLASKPAARVSEWTTNPPAPGGVIRWSVPMSSACFATASVSLVYSNPGASASAVLEGTSPRGHADVAVATSAPGVPVNVTVICPSR